MKKLLFLPILIFCSFCLDGQLCWKKFDPSSCKYSIISELGLSRLIGPSIQNRSFQPTVDLELNLGLGKIINQQWGLAFYGFGIASIGDGGAIQGGFRSRISYFAANNYELSLTPGIILHHSRSSVDQSPAFSLEASVAWKNNLGVFSRLDFLQLENETQNTQINIGLRTGGDRAVFGASGGVLAAAIGLLVLLITLT